MALNVFDKLPKIIIKHKLVITYNNSSSTMTVTKIYIET